MNVVILHCHFERGGVTQVVENHVLWLRNCDRVNRIVLVSGDRASGLSTSSIDSVDQVSIPDFDYDTREFTSDSLQQRSAQIVRSVNDQLAAIGVRRDESVLHWHNHSLGKNTAGPSAIRQLAESGWRILLQIHDFAEDNRPDNYRRLIKASGAVTKVNIDRYLYPVASQIHYATLTRADASALQRLGVPASQTHCLPNSVVAPSAGHVDQEQSLAKVRDRMNLPADARWCIYPVRGIRRKNVGEFLMLSRWARPDQFSGLTLCPATPVERSSYERWKLLAAEVAPRAVFDAGQVPEISFAENMSAADFIVSTSVAEGFGMAFLEPWLVGREVIARRLSTVTDDFEESGVQLTKLYDEMPIPGDSGWIRDCVAESGEAIKSAWSSLPTEFQPSLEFEIRDGAEQIDFARLTPRRQVEVLRRVSADSCYNSDVMRCCDELIQNLNDPADEQLIRRNAKVVGEQYSPQRAGESLIAIYEALISAPHQSSVESPRHAGSGVDLIADVRPFFPCRTEVLHG